ncbi:MAG: diaminopimelate decarboxylase, partial [Desulfovibrionaceae bacterium]|nr:diaminopimelate decarboxylase [Desulfovibrionaceae bacterium]
METGDIPFRRLAGEYGVPLYVYDRHALEERCNALRQAFPEGVLQTVTGQGLGIDAASAGEVLRARALGLPRDMIHYSAPGKSDAELAKVLDCCTIVADSYGELARLDALCETRGVTVGAGLRVSPSMAYGPGPAPELVPAGPDKFGVDEESLAGHADFLKSLRHVRVAGVHVYLRSQVLGA